MHDLGDKELWVKSDSQLPERLFSYRGVELCNNAGRLSLFLFDVYCLLFALMHGWGLALGVVIFGSLSEVFSLSFAGT